MLKCNVRNPEEALAYIADCCLATVGHMASLKSRKKGEFERQTSIAQTACDWMRDMRIDPKGTRAVDIIGKQSVAEWAKKFMA